MVGDAVWQYFLPVHHLPLYLCLRKYISIIQSIYLFIHRNVCISDYHSMYIYIFMYLSDYESVYLTHNFPSLTRSLLSCHCRFFIAFTSSSSRRDQNAKSVGSNPKLE